MIRVVCRITRRAWGDNVYQAWRLEHQNFSRLAALLVLLDKGLGNTAQRVCCETLAIDINTTDCSHSQPVRIGVGLQDILGR